MKVKCDGPGEPIREPSAAMMYKLRKAFFDVPRKRYDYYKEFTSVEEVVTQVTQILASNLDFGRLIFPNFGSIQIIGK